MAPKTKGKSKAAALLQQPKTLSSRVRPQLVDQQELDEAEEQQELVVPVQLAFTSLISTTWNMRHTSAFCMIDSCATTSPIWRDSFCVSLEPAWLNPPLHQYLRSEDADSPAERLLVQFWRESRFTERLQLGYKLLHDVGDVTGAAMLLFDVAPAPQGAQDWVTRIQLACAAYKHAWHMRADDSMASQAMEGQLTLQEVCWMRAQWLLARTLCAALFNTGRRTAGLLAMVVSALTAVMPEDPLGSRFMVQRSLGGCSAWDNLADITKPYLVPPQRLQDLTPNPFGADAATMATAYNRALACFQRYGPTDTRSVAAVVAAFERDPSRWVPLLLAGGALGVPGGPPQVALGSKEEAAAYCCEYGSCWWVGSLLNNTLSALMDQGAELEQAEPVTWLAQQAGLTELVGLKLDLSHAGVMMYNLAMFNNSMTCCLPVVVDEMNVRINGSMSIGTAGSTKPEECPGIARSCLALLCCLSSCTQGLPPLDTCDMRLWARVGNTMAISTGWEGAAASLRGRLSDSANSVFDIAHRLVTQCRLWQQQEKRGELQGRLGLVWPSELLHWERTLEELRPARARLLWQAGLVRMAKDVAAELLEHQEQLHAKLQSQLSTFRLAPPTARDAALASLLRGTLAAPGPVLCSLTAIRDMQEFLNQQAVQAARRTLSSRTRGGGARGGNSSSRGGAGGAAEVQYQRYEEATPDRLRRFVADVLDAAGGEAGINEALDLAQLRQACGRATGDSSDTDEDDSTLFTAASSSTAVAVDVIDRLLTFAMPAPAAAALGGVHRVPAARQQQQHEAGSSSSSSNMPAIVSALRACLSGDAAPWVSAMGAAPDTSEHLHCCCCPHHGVTSQAAAAFRAAALGDPDIIRAAVSSILTSKGIMTSENAPELEAVISAMMEQLPSMMGAGEDGSSSGVDDKFHGSSRGDGGDIYSSSGGTRAMHAVQQGTVLQQDTSTQRTAGAAEGAGPLSATFGQQGGAGVASSSQASARDVPPAAAGGSGVRPAPMFVFGSSPEAASAAASAAFDAVLQSYTPPAQPSARNAAAGVFAGSNSPAGSAAAASRAALGGTGTSAGSSASPVAAAAAGGDAAATGLKVCACCGGHFAKVYRCSRCAAAGLLIGYCSASCQKAHWNAGHKGVCGKPPG